MKKFLCIIVVFVTLLSGCGISSVISMNNINVTAGKAKLVFIAPDGTLTGILEITTEEDVNEGSPVTLPIEKGTNRIKLVAADEANIEYELNIEKGVYSVVGM